jgi:1-acyl-sn-glycerol-3-phosphate acyltransferase
VLARLRSAYAWALLSVIMLPLFPALKLMRFLTRESDPKGDRLRVFMARWVSVYGWATPLYRFEIVGSEKLPRGAPYVMIANHESGLDILAMLMLSTPARFIAEDYLFEATFASWLLRSTGQIPVRIGDRESGHQALAIAQASLAEGTPIVIFPEGHLSPDVLAPFRPGAFVLAQRAHVPLVPVLLEGAGRAWRPGTMVVTGSHVIRIRILDSIPVNEVTASQPEELAERTHKRFVAIQARA